MAYTKTLTADDLNLEELEIIENRLIRQFIKHGPMTVNEVRCKMRMPDPKMSVPIVTSVLEMLVECDVMEKVQHNGNAERKGRPTVRYVYGD